MTELVIIETLNPVEIFANNGLEPLLVNIETKVRAFKPDMSSKAGRDAIASIAYKVARSKTALDKMGKDLTDEWRKQTSTVNAMRNIAKERLEALQEEVRKPLTVWEDTEKSRVGTLKLRLQDLKNAALDTAFITTSVELEERLLKANSLYQFDWQEFQGVADGEYENSKNTLNDRLQKQKQFEAEKIELERLRKEAAEREQKEREQKIANETAERARIDAENKAEAERKEAALKADKEKLDAIAAEQKKARDAAERAEKARLTEEQVKREAQQRAEKAEAEKKAQEAARIAAEERAKRAEAEKKALEAKNKREAEERAKRGLNTYGGIIKEWGDAHSLVITEDMIMDLISRMTSLKKEAA